MEKLFVMQVAAQLTVAACNGLGAGATRPIDPTLQDPNQRACNLEVWEIFRAYYHAIQAAVADNTDWPTPTVAQGNTVPNVISSGLTSALPAILTTLTNNFGGPVGNTISSILKLLTPQAQQTVPPVTGNIPAPGVKAS